MKSNKAVVKVMHPKPEEQSIAPLIKEVLGRLGEDPGRDGLLQTPDRVNQALRFLTSVTGWTSTRSSTAPCTK